MLGNFFIEQINFIIKQSQNISSLLLTQGATLLLD